MRPRKSLMIMVGCNDYHAISLLGDLQRRDGNRQRVEALNFPQWDPKPTHNGRLD